MIRAEQSVAERAVTEAMHRAAVHSNSPRTPVLSFAIAALLLVRLEARSGEWQTVEALAGHFGLPRAAVLLHCEALLQERGVAVERSPTSHEIVRARIQRPDEAVAPCA